MGGGVIPRSETVKFLGLILDSNLSWNDHINSVIRKILSITRAFWRTSAYIPHNLKRQIYFALVHTHLTYLCSVWGHCGGTALGRLLRIQNRALKILYGLPILTSTTELYKMCKVPKITEQISYSSAILMAKIIRGEILSNVNIKRASELHKYSTRKIFLIKKSTPKTTKFGLCNVLYSCLLYTSPSPRD